MNTTDGKNNFFKNPIGVIGIFLVLTEAIASTVIVNSNLSDLQNTMLVIFVVVFPCFVLSTFYRLVTRHHEKLYSPSDYKDEQNFVNTYNSATQKDEIKVVPGTSAEINKQLEAIELDVNLLKDAIFNIMEWQKKMVSNMETSLFSDVEKDDYESFMEEYFEEIEEEQTLKVEISPMYKSTKLVEKLVQQGYMASIYRSPFHDKKVVPNAEHEAIWMGSEVPVDMAVEVVKMAKNFYPHIKYIQLSDASDGAPEFVKYQIYIGGATSTAKERKLRALSADAFEKFYQIQDEQELHEYIREFES